MSIPTSELQSTSTLGTGKVTSHRERLDQTEDLDVRRLMDGRSNKRKRRNHDVSIMGFPVEDEDAELDSSDIESSSSSNIATPSQVQIVDVSANLATPAKSTQSIVVGGALRRNSDGTSMAPRVMQRKKIGQKVCRLLTS